MFQGGLKIRKVHVPKVSDVQQIKFERHDYGVMLELGEKNDEQAKAYVLGDCRGVSVFGFSIGGTKW